jgi:hypothetical protein
MVSSVYGESIPLKSESGTFVVPVVINDKITLDFPRAWNAYWLWACAGRPSASPNQVSRSCRGLP